MRKKPRQERSRQMVEALVDATAAVIGEFGLAEASTNRIAERAGVSVGSLYQYFESRDALIAALMERQAAEILQLVDERLRALISADARAVTRGLLTAVFDFVQRDESRLELLRNWQQLRTQRTFQTLERHMFEACRLYLLRHHEEFEVANLPAALFVAINGTLYTVAHYLSLPRPQISREEVIDALADMLGAYLGAARRVAPKRKRPR